MGAVDRSPLDAMRFGCIHVNMTSDFTEYGWAYREFKLADSCVGVELCRPSDECRHFLEQDMVQEVVGVLD